MFAGLIGGAAAGIVAHIVAGDSPALAAFVRHGTQPAGQIFLRLLFMLVLPLLFASLALGVAGLGDIRRLGRIGLKTLVYTVVVSAIAVFLGVFLVSTLRPGDGLPEAARTRLLADAAGRAGSATTMQETTGTDFIAQIVPRNPVEAAANGDYLAVMFFALFVGIGLALTRTEATRRVEEVLQGVYDVAMRLLAIVLAIAPIGVACLLFTLTARLGYDILVQLGRYVLVVLLGLAIHQFVVYAFAVRVFGGMSPRHFFAAIRPAMLTAFATASSNATLPTALQVAEHGLHLPRPVARFVLTLGSTANQNGTALFEGVTVLFLAQFYGVDLSLAQQASVVAVCVLGGIGTAGVPSGSIPVIAMILGLVGIPVEGIGLVLGVNHFLDMCRTTINVTGDLAAAVVVARGEDETDLATA